MKKLYGLLIFVFLIVCAIPLIFYAWHMYLGPLITGNGVVHTISSDGKWDDFAALWSAAFGAIGSIATAATLVFLIWQYFFKQQELFDRNIEVINFQKYEIHNGEIVFIERGKLYRSIFPKNNFSKIEYSVDLTSVHKAGELQDIRTKHNQLRDKLKSQELVQAGNEARETNLLIGDVCTLMELLGLYMRREKESGDFLLYEKIVFNSKQPDYFLAIIERTINELMSFSGNKELTSLMGYSRTSYLLRNLDGYANHIVSGCKPGDTEIEYVE